MTSAYSIKDVATIKEWIKKEAYLPQDLDDFVIAKFLHSCYGSLEKTKKCIERFCTARTNMPEVYSNRDPLSKGMQTSFHVTSVCSFLGDDDHEILIHQYDDPTLKNLDFYNLLKSFTTQADHWILTNKTFAKSHIIVIDIKDYSLKMIPKVNIMYFRDFILFLLEGMPVRVKEVHMVNAPSYYEKLYALIKPVLPAEICRIMNFHPDVSGLHRMVDPRWLPKELGGDAPSMRLQHLDWVDKITEHRKWYLDDNRWKADLKLKPKDNKTQENLNGSFRMLAID